MSPATSRGARRYVRPLLAVSALVLAAALAALLLEIAHGRQAIAVLMGLAGGGLAVGLLLWWSPGLLDTTPRALVWRSLFEFGPPYLGYLIFAFHARNLIRAADPGWPRLAIACLPVLLVAWAAIAFARYLRGLDELQQRIELQSLACAAMLTSAACAAAGFLSAAGALMVPGDAVIWVFPGLLTGYCVLRAALTRRYE